MAEEALFLDPVIGRPAIKIGYFPDQWAFDRFAAAYNAAMAVLPRPDAIAAISTTFGPVRAYRFGPGGDTPLVLLAGRQASTPMWAANLPSLLAQRTVWALDSIGEPGASAQHRELADGRDQATWIAETLAGLGLARAHLLGVSIGGNLAVQTALHRPDTVASITLLDPANTFAPLSWKMIAVSLGSTVPMMPDGVRHRLLSWISGGAPVDETVPEGQLIASGMKDYRVAQPLLPRPTEEQLRGLTVPVLALFAGRSIVHDAAKAAETARLIPGAQVEVWADASHAINGEHPDRIARRFAEFTATI
ncbi:alpha/beta fold hydrolase [Nocardia neocaledoniensis]|uniref:alpha/beta fold hydrolase n=1 Tax=Nocardia neocaledoniensis TaxID=236511 RepID=UPI0024557755|nr:alpha/beta fold hydrolase [Nocardia neocaledoniensis]